MLRRLLVGRLLLLLVATSASEKLLVALLVLLLASLTIAERSVGNGKSASVVIGLARLGPILALVSGVAVEGVRETVGTVAAYVTWALSFKWCERSIEASGAACANWVVLMELEAALLITRGILNPNGCKHVPASGIAGSWRSCSAMSVKERYVSVISCSAAEYSTHSSGLQRAKREIQFDVK